MKKETLEIAVLEIAARNKATYLKVNAAFNENRLEDASNFFALNYTSNSVNNTGRAGLKEYFETMRKMWPDVKLTVKQLVAEGDYVMALCTAAATHTKVVMGIEPTSKKIEASFWDLHHYDKNGVVIEGWNMLDNAALMQQLGLLPTPK